MTLLTVTVGQDLSDGTWWVRALFDVAGRQYAARWAFPTQGDADAFADDPEVVTTAGEIALLEQTGGAG